MVHLLQSGTTRAHGGPAAWQYVPLRRAQASLRLACVRGSRLLCAAAPQQPGDVESSGTAARVFDTGALRRQRGDNPTPRSRARSPAVTSSRGGAALTKHIMDVASGEKVLELAASSLTFFNERHVATALLRLSKLPQPPDGHGGDPRFVKLLSASELLMDKMGAQALSNLLYACSKLRGIILSERWLAQYWRMSELQLNVFNAQDCANTLYACGQLRKVPPADWLQRFWQASADQLAHFTPQALSNTLYACGQLRIVPPGDWLQLFWPASAVLLKQFNSQDFANTLYACALLGLVPPGVWLHGFWLASADQLAHFSPQALSNTLYACALLGIVPPAAWLRQFWQACAANEGEFTVQAQCNILYAIAALGLWDAPLLQQRWQQLQNALASRSSAEWSEADRLDVIQMYNVYLVAAVERPGLLSVPSPAVLEAARKMWREDLTSRTRTSALQSSVSDCLSAMGIAHEVECWCERSEHSIDVAIIADALRIALEVDGPHHFLDNGETNGPTRLRNRFLMAHGWRVAVVPYHEWDALGTQQERAAYLTRVLA